MPTIFIVQSNTAPTFALALKRDDSAIDLTSASLVELIIKNRNTGTITNSGHQQCTISSPATAGNIIYTAQATDFPEEAMYLGEVKITYSGGSIERLYEQVQFPARANYG